MENIFIKKLTHEYVNDVSTLEKEYIGTGDVDAIKNSLNSDKLNYYILLKNDKVVGFMECLILPPEMELYDIVVSKENQGKGYSKILMDYMISLAKENNVETILLEVNSINNKAINLYQKYGFKEYSIRKNYYGDSDAVLMKLKLL